MLNLIFAHVTHLIPLLGLDLILAHVTYLIPLLGLVGLAATICTTARLAAAVTAAHAAITKTPTATAPRFYNCDSYSQQTAHEQACNIHSGFHYPLLRNCP
ncbi:hypothetical protein PROAA_1280026 [Candidatus Propionivibrio aalborgensis]|uniref:Uncharacterized protein n=1 Tax=Candidatus Propionivibrio aalborgensis TaxID=1860101 RepID=A0A1A8XH01_9RHOO|nr:hypothetical protein PROAA_1280026 [Candidatus Propionivibrio aalborgensis]